MLERWYKLWGAFSLSHQCAPLLAQGGSAWTTWLILGGRGAGKTRAGAEWVRAQAADPSARIALIGETGRDVREVMIEGVSGLLRVHEHGARARPGCPRARLEWRNGAIAQAFSAEDPDSLRGPQFSAAWCDELAKWRHAEATFDMLQFGLRLGDAAAAGDHHHAAADRSAEAADRRPGDRGDACRHARRTPTISRRRSSTRSSSAIRARGSAGRNSTARSSRSAPTRCGRARGSRRCRVEAAPPLFAHRGGGRSAGAARQGPSACGLIAAGRHGDLALCARRRDRGGPLARGLGQQGDRAVAAGWRPIASWSR